jgi:Na+/proline symporter
MVGIIVDAMFSATMAAISADLNAIASVLTRDVYLRLFRPLSSERTLVRIGRLCTLGVGVIVIGLSIWIAVSHQESLFHLMVTAFGLLLAPTMLPVLAGLTIRWLTWKGALTGFITGLSMGLATFAVKSWYLPTQDNISPEWANYTFEGISIFLNIAATAAGLWLGSVLPKADAREKERIAVFFKELDRPVSPDEVNRHQTAARPALGIGTATVGILLILAGLFAGSPQARWVDPALGALLLALGFQFLRRKKVTTPAKHDSITV